MGGVVKSVTNAVGDAFGFGGADDSAQKYADALAEQTRQSSQNMQQQLAANRDNSVFQQQQQQRQLESQQAIDKAREQAKMEQEQQGNPDVSVGGSDTTQEADSSTRKRKTRDQFQGAAGAGIRIL